MQHHAGSIPDVLQTLGASESGLTSAEAEARLKTYGENKLLGKKEQTLLQKFLRQFADFLVIILIIAAIVSMILGEVLDGGVIISIVILNAILGVIQENRAGNALKALKEMSSPVSKVVRDGQIKHVPSNLLVPGDIVALDAGDYIPADVRLIRSANLKIDESALTGESVASEKDATVVLPEETDIGDRVNSAFMGTVITYGRGRGLIIGSGMNTQMGRIAAMLTEHKEGPTPLQISLNHLGKTLGIICLAVCVIIFVIGLFRDIPPLEIFMTAVSLAVAAIPEGLTMVVTVILALGMQKMVKSNAIIKRLSAVETLGSTTVICSDKTGTLTQNKMTVVNLYSNGRFYDVTGTGYDATGEIVVSKESESEKDSEKEAAADTISNELLEGAALCNDAEFHAEEKKMIGDPTEGALVVLASKAGIDQKEINRLKPRVNEIPFDSTRKLMSTIHANPNEVERDTGGESFVMYTKGAPDEILRVCEYIMESGEIVQLTDSDRDDIMKANEQFASQALRVLGVAFKYTQSKEATEDQLAFTGLIGMIDPPRDEAKEAITVCKRAGINVKMITGDHKATALAIAKELTITEDGAALSGREIDSLDDQALIEAAATTNVFARVSPEHKVRLVNAVKANGNIAAMTGDGVNDAPSLKKADIGVAMGITGTDVSKEAADMILTDDNFASIVRSVEEGRTIYNNIRKVVGYLLSCNIGEILVIFIAMIIGWPVPLLPIQLLAINLITDAFPAFALGMEEQEAGIMDVPPRNPKVPIVDKRMVMSVTIQSIALAIGTLASFLYAWNAEGFDPVHTDIAKTACFFTLVLGELLRSYTARSERISILKIKIFGNGYLNKCVLLSIAFLFAAVYMPGVNGVFRNIPLQADQLGIAVLFAFVPLIGGEAAKIFARK
ncbi:MAG: cation-translocating P-type ATPase [Clostridiales bacterium]|nr:cation-translocating P-type ATPase [Clostridiales bacterium]